MLSVRGRGREEKRGREGNEVERVGQRGGREKRKGGGKRERRRGEREGGRVAKVIDYRMFSHDRQQ